MKRFICIALVIFSIVCAVKIFLYWQNDTVGITRYIIENDRIPDAFHGYKIIHLSDIHGKEFGDDNKSLIHKIKKQSADLLVITGDLVDDGVENSSAVIDNLIKSGALPNALYAVTGNHDKWSQDFKTKMASWEKSGLLFLENKSVFLTKNNEKITLHGIADPGVWEIDAAKKRVKESMKKVNPDTGFDILLFHRANMLDLFDSIHFDLVLSGHLHGGQMRIPFVGGLKSPHGDWFPAYSGGRYDTATGTYIVSRGIGNSVGYPRVFNRPEIIVITLKTH